MAPAWPVLCHPARVALLPDTVRAESVELRRWRPAFAEGLCAAVADSLPELRPWMPWAQEEPTVERLVALLAEGDGAFEAGTEWQFVMVEADGERVVGATGLHLRHGPGTVEIGYWVRSDATHQGFATMASRALTTAVFSHLDDIDEVEIRMDAANRRSAAVPSRLGFHLSGEVDREIEAPGQSGRWMVWVMTRGDWDPSGRSARHTP